MQYRALYYNFLAVCIGIMMVLPAYVWSAGLVTCGGPGEPACQMCYAVSTVQGVINWLVGILGILAALMIIYAGVRLVISAGNVEAKTTAKSIMGSMLLGYVIVLAAWLGIDFGFKWLLNEDFGPWNQLECVEQPNVVDPKTITEIDIGLASTFGAIFVTDADGNITQVDPDGSTTATGGSCSVISDPSSPCHPSKLSCFGARASQASQICNIESGGRANAISGTDRCKDGRSFSGGLWQVNILAHGNALGCDTSGFKTYGGGGAQGSCLDRRTNSKGVQYCAVWNCEFQDTNAYNQCIGRLFDPSVNTGFACQLFSRQGFTPWRISAGRCGIPE